jgi:hypothetical protein
MWNIDNEIPIADFFRICLRADKSLAFPISPTGGLQHNQKNFSWMD